MTVSAGPRRDGSRLDLERKVEELIDNLRETEVIYHRLVDLTRQQCRILEGGDTEELVRIAHTKEAEMARLEPVQERMRPTREAWDTIQKAFTAEQKSSVQEAVSRVERVLRDLLRLEEEQNRAVLEQRRETLDDIRRLEAGRKILNAYSRSEPGARGILDQKE